MLELSTKSIWMRFCGRGKQLWKTIGVERAAGVNCPLHFFGRAVESVLMAKVYIVFICAKQQ